MTTTQYNLPKYTDWSDGVDQGVQLYKNTYGKLPKVLVASTETFAKIVFLVNAKPEAKSNVHDFHDQLKIYLDEQPDDFVQLEGYQGDGFYLSFCQNDDLGDWEFELERSEEEL